VRITIVTVGSRGDVQPYVALGVGLVTRGYAVRVATHRSFRDAVVERGLEFAPLEGDPQRLVSGRRGQAWLESGESLLRFLIRFLRLFRPLMEQYLHDAWEACQGSDAIVYSPLGFAGHHAAEALGVPSWLAAVQPAVRTRAFPVLPLTARRHFGGAVNWLSYGIYEQLAWQPLRGPLNRWRKELGLTAESVWGPFGRLRRQSHPVLHAYSPVVVPRPADWPAWAHVTGYWFLDRPAEWSPPAELRAFLDAGPPPVYVGFGSMVAKDLGELADIVLAALRRNRARGVIHRGWAGLAPADLPDDVLGIDSVPHDWLFPRVAAVVHHGGAGTTAAGLRAGVPTVVAPFFADQPFWAQQVERLGAGPAPVPQAKLTAERLTTAIQRALTDPRIRKRATGVGEQIRAEDGVARAAEIIGRGMRRG
jgi:UDP:flavonoid glycosyltransferase YjiC (YdhE family)